jgi:SdpC family antimicrobial peptide
MSKKMFYIVVLVVLFGFLITVLSAFKASSTKLSSSSDEDIFRGIAFGEGALADLLPEIWGSYHAAYYSKLSDAQKQDLFDLDSQIVSAIVQDDKTFLPRFAQMVQSGNHLEVQAAIGEMNIVVSNALDKVPVVAASGSSKKKKVYITVNVAVNTLVAVQDHAVAVNNAFLSRVDPSKAEDQLQADTWIDVITKRFAL